MVLVGAGLIAALDVYTGPGIVGNLIMPADQVISHVTEVTTEISMARENVQSVARV